MNLKQLKELSGKRIINMKQLYQEAGRPPSSMRSRLSHMNGTLSHEESEALELAVIRQIEEVVEILEIDKSKVANALEITEYDIQKGEPVTPCAYLVGPKNTRPVFMPEDKVKRREARSGAGEHLFWPRDKIVEMLVKNTRLTATERGRNLFTEEEEQQISQS